MEKSIHPPPHHHPPSRLLAPKKLVYIPSKLISKMCTAYPNSSATNTLTSIPSVHPSNLQEKMSRPGDWNCKSCQHLNFSWRDTCQLCNNSRYGECYGFTGPAHLPGDWYCSARNCGVHNFASRMICFKCGALRNESGTGYGNTMPCSMDYVGRSGWKSGDWICTSPDCNEHNFASRGECFRCNTPRGYNTNT